MYELNINKDSYYSEVRQIPRGTIRRNRLEFLNVCSKKNITIVIQILNPK